MKFTLYNLGKTNSDYLKKGIDEYFHRINHFIDFSIIDLPGIKQSGNLSAVSICKKEGDILKKALAKSDIVVLLDENGIEYNSRNFAVWLNKLTNQSVKRISFVTGGAYGFSDEMYKTATYKIALSKLTFTHQMVRLVFTEQLYRACTILNNIPYHNN